MSMTQSIAWALFGMLSPLRAALQDPQAISSFLEEMGWSVDVAEEHLPTLQQALAVSGLIEQITEVMPRLRDMEAGEIVAEVIMVAQDVYAVIDGLTRVTGSQIASLNAPLNTTAFWGELALALPEFLLLRWLRQRRNPALFSLLELFGIVVETGRSLRYDMPSYALHWELLPQLFSDPLSLLAATYGWGGDFSHQVLLERLARLSAALGFSGTLQLPSPTIVDRFYDPENAPDTYQLEWIAYDDWLPDTGVWLKAGLLLLPIPIPNNADNPNALYLGNILQGSTEVSTPLGDGALHLNITSEAEGTGAIGVVFAPGSNPDVQTYLPSVNYEIGLEYTPPAPSATDNSSGLTLSGVEAALSITGSPADPEISIRIATVRDGLVLAVQPGEGDSFVREFLGGTALTCKADVGFSWSKKDGLTLLTGGGIDLLIPLNLELFGILTILSLHLELSLEDGLITGMAAISASGTLGPFTLTVEDIGIKALVEPLDAESTYLARLGSMGVDLGFKPPSGAGAAFDFLGIVYGGGFIRRDPDTGDYSGIITVQLAVVGVTATAIISTQLPDDPDGWSLFVSINVNLGGIPLGFGFTLEKVGGLIGIHRSIDQDEFQTGIRTGLLDSVLFPPDPIGDAPRILSDIQRAFPITPQSFVVGAMLQIGWGVPTLITADVGFIIQLPDIVVMLIGQAETILPVEEAALVEIHFDVLGIIDLAEGTLSIDAGVRDSQIVGFVLTGQMALRARFLGQPSFLLAMGGFHPAFVPPEGFPTLARMGFGLNVGDWLSISLESYLALTSNTVQFGAGLYLTAKLVGFRIEGGVEINTLITFSPFSFRADLSFYITVSAGSAELLGVLLSGYVSGPNPFFVSGKAEFKILGLKQEVSIEESIGGKTAIDDVDDIPLLDDVVAAFQETENWRAVDDGSRIGAVLLAGVDDPDAEPTVHPGGSVEVVQRVAPLEVELEHYGSAEIDGDDDFEIAGVEAGGASIAWEYVEDWFAPAQFFDMAKDEKLDSPSFEMMKAGLRFGDDEAEDGEAADAVYNYEQIIHDPEFKAPRFQLGELHQPQDSMLGALNLQKTSASSHTLFTRSGAQRFVLSPVRYVIVHQQTLKSGPGMPARSMTHAEAAQKAALSENRIVVTVGERATE